ncbi:hypothetical protein DFO61_2332 [Ectopseudomonas oleovorans]|uniref:DUF6869 domain-containing protein n=1 Tax=Ectopseudomonas oleovorans TaxID=301 RepID=A0A397N6G1_ECTOL|nr:hypothetical protein [Pseudomonas oleovorans]RIA31608.1 hypothetical protein DFO61_2332 [Pseudomonas oleovorans]
MDREEIQEIAENWVRCQNEYEASGSLSAGAYELDELIHKDPHKALKVILETLSIIPKRPESNLVQALAAGPLEILLVYKGSEVVKEIEHEALQNADLRLLLGGVWQSSIQAEVWSSILKFRSESW